MVEKERSAVFDLKIARGLVNDVAEQTEDVVELQQLAHDEDRFWESLKLSWKTGSETERLKNDLKTAIDLAKKASTKQPDSQLEDGATPQAVVAQAHFQRGLIEFRLGNWEEALPYFEESHKVVPTQEALYNIALCKLNQARGISPTLSPFEVMKRIHDRDKMAKKKGFSLLRQLKEGVKAGLETPFVSGSYSIEEAVNDFNKVIDMDPESDLAIEAGKIITRLKR